MSINRTNLQTNSNDPRLARVDINDMFADIGYGTTGIVSPITTTGEASKLFKFSAIANTILHFFRIRKSSTTAFDVQNDSSTSIFNVDTTNEMITGTSVTTTGANAKLVKTSSLGNISMTQSVDGNVGVILNNTSTSVNANTGFQAKSDMLNYLSIWAYGSGRTNTIFGKVIGNKTTIVTQGVDCTGMLLGNLTNVPITVGINNASIAEITLTESAWSIPLKTTQLKLSALNTAPASATATGTTGEIRIDANYIYICTATNTWKRTALTTF